MTKNKKDLKCGRIVIFVSAGKSKKLYNVILSKEEEEQVIFFLSTLHGGSVTAGEEVIGMKLK